MQFYSYTFLCRVVCLSVVCHICAPCLNHSMDAIWQVHLWGPVTHCVRCAPWLSVEGEIWRVEPHSHNMQLQIATATCRIERKRFRLLPNYVGACYPCFYLALSMGPFLNLARGSWSAASSPIVVWGNWYLIPTPLMNGWKNSLPYCSDESFAARFRCRWVLSQLPS